MPRFGAEIWLASPAGFEPATFRLEGGCSGPLSYGDAVRARRAERVGAAGPLEPG
jgi:hypothetical protein